MIPAKRTADMALGGINVALLVRLLGIEEPEELPESVAPVGLSPPPVAIAIELVPDLLAKGWTLG